MKPPKVLYWCRKSCEYMFPDCMTMDDPVINKCVHAKKRKQFTPVESGKGKKK